MTGVASTLAFCSVLSTSEKLQLFSDAEQIPPYILKLFEDQVLEKSQ